MDYSHNQRINQQFMLHFFIHRICIGCAKHFDRMLLLLTKDCQDHAIQANTNHKECQGVEEEDFTVAGGLRNFFKNFKNPTFGFAA